MKKPLLPRPDLGVILTPEQVTEYMYATYPELMDRLRESEMRDEALAEQLALHDGIPAQKVPADRRPYKPPAYHALNHIAEFHELTAAINRRLKKMGEEE